MPSFQQVERLMEVLAPYSKICPWCNKRYGTPNAQGWVDIELCDLHKDKKIREL